MASDALLHTPFSRLTRQTAAVLGEVESRDVVLERRDGPNLMLTTAAREADLREALATVAQLASLLPEDQLPLYAERLVAGQPWMRPLPPADVRLLMCELIDVSQRCFALGDFAPLGQLLHEWRNTALVHHNPDLKRVLDADADIEITVTRPEA